MIYFLLLCCLSNILIFLINFFTVLCQCFAQKCQYFQLALNISYFLYKLTICIFLYLIPLSPTFCHLLVWNFISFPLIFLTQKCQYIQLGLNLPISLHKLTIRIFLYSLISSILSCQGLHLALITVPDNLTLDFCNSYRLIISSWTYNFRVTQNNQSVYRWKMGCLLWENLWCVGVYVAFPFWKQNWCESSWWHDKECDLAATMTADSGIKIVLTRVIVILFNLIQLEVELYII